MKKSVYILFLLAAVLGTSSCHKGSHEEMEAKSDPVMLKIRVSLSDLLPKTRAGGVDDPNAAAANENEKIQTLRVIVVNSKNDVEGNQYMDLTDIGGTPVTEQTVTVRNVASNDVKMIYLIANEGATRKLPASQGGGEGRLVDYDFTTARITPGLKFPLKEIEALKMRLNENSDHLSNGLQGGLPMSECHRVRIPVVPPDAPGRDELEGDGFFLLDENDQIINPAPGADEEIFGYRQTLWITRTAVKFTCEVTNNQTAGRVKLKGLRMQKMAGEAYFLPRVLERDGHEIKEFAVPVETMENNKHFEFKYDLSATEELQKGKPFVLPPIYLLEGKYTDKNGVKEGDNICNYQAALILERDGKQDTTSYMYLPNLPVLPRNTHVVLRATINDPADILWKVDVVPYGEVILEPGFGI